MTDPIVKFVEDFSPPTKSSRGHATNGQRTRYLLKMHARDLSMLGAFACAWYWASWATSSTIAGLVLVTILAAGLLAHPVTRRPIVGYLRVGWIKHYWTKAIWDSGADERHTRNRKTADWRGPRVTRIETRAAGDLLHVVVRRGGSVKTLEDHKDVLAASLSRKLYKVNSIRITPDDDSRKARVLIVRRDPFASLEPRRWPDYDKTRTSVWEPVQLGLDNDLQPVSILLAEPGFGARNLIVGGTTGAGKSVALSIIIAHCARDPRCRMILLDGKEVDLPLWEPVADTVVGSDGKEAIKALKRLVDVRLERYADVRARGLRHVPEGDPTYLLVVDELEYYFQQLSAEDTKEFSRLLLDLIARGRAAGIIVVCATQKPAHDVIPTKVRDLFNWAWALRCNNAQSSDTILGQGWASDGYDASSIPGRLRGVGYLRADGAKPERVRSYYLADSEVVESASRGAAARADALLESLGTQPTGTGGA